MVDVLLGNKGMHMYNGNIQPDPFCCEKCNRVFKSQRTLHNHKCSFCEHCRKCFSTFQRLRSHSCRPIVQGIVCKICQAPYMSSVEKHTCASCERCGKMFSSQQSLTKHSTLSCHALDSQADNQEDPSPNNRTSFHIHVENTVKVNNSKKNGKPKEHQEYLYKSVKEKPQTEYSEKNDKQIEHEGEHSVRCEKEQHQTKYPEKNNSGQECQIEKEGVLIPDEVINVVVTIMREHSPDMADYIGQLSPVELHLAANSMEVSQIMPYIPNDKFCINFHYTNLHWVISTFNPQTGTVTVYDSLRTPQRINNIKIQLKLLYSPNIRQIHYPYVMQQQSDPSCGAFAVAFAFCALLGIPPEIQKFDVQSMRKHLKHILDIKAVKPFPTTEDRLADYFISQTKLQKQMQATTIRPSMPSVRKMSQKTSECRKQTYDATVQIETELTNSLSDCKAFEQTRQAENKERKRLGMKHKQSNPTFLSHERERKRLKRLDKKSDHSLQVENEKDRLRMKDNRSNPTFQSQEREEKRSKRLGKKSDHSLQVENEKERIRKKQNRLNPTFQSQERERKRSKRLGKKSDHSLQVENEKERIRKKQNRLNPTFQSQERERKRSKRLGKKSDHSLQVENERECIRKKQNRLNPTFQSQERERKRSKRLGKKSDHSIQVENEKDRIRKKQNRLNPTFQSQERERKRSKRLGKKSDHSLQVEIEKDCIRKKQNRLNPIFQSQERERKRSKRLGKKSDHSLQVENEKERIRKKQNRLNPIFQSQEKERKRSKRLGKKSDHSIQVEIEKDRIRKKQNRLNPNVHSKESELRNLQRQNYHKENTNTIENAALLFSNTIKKGCSFVCTCCYQLWFSQSVVLAKSVGCTDPTLRSKCYTNKLSYDNKEWLCVTCATSIRKKTLPVLARANGMFFPVRAPELNLNSLEERLVAPINPFMQIRELPRGGQTSIKGNVVNVPSDNLRVVTMLPRRLDDTGTIAVKLKRRLRYKSNYMYQNIRPEACFRAVTHLMQKQLFHDYVLNGIDQDWLTQHISDAQNTDWVEFLQPLLIDPAEPVNPEVIDEQHDGNVSSNLYIATENEHIAAEQSQSNAEDNDEWSEDDDTEEASSGSFGNRDTMMFDDILDADCSKSLSLAPSEGNQPISGIACDLEELAFPTIFCGDRRKNNKEREKPAKYSDICKSELRRDDRRAAMSVNNIFFKAKKLQNKHIQDKVWLSMKRLQSKGQTLTAGELRDPQKIEQIVRLDEGYHIFRTLRGSPPFWQAAKKDIFAMLRQLGLPTWFLSLSAAETKWTDLLHSLGLSVDQKNYSDEEILAFTYMTKCRLIQADPVTTARFFYHRVQTFFKHFLESASTPIGHISDHFYRVEFQHRGSPHIHCLIWIENAPTYNKDSLAEVNSFIEKYITTAKASDIQDFVKYQTHRHSHTCKKKGNVCRFHFPLPPMLQTQVLQPLTDLPPQEMKRHKDNWLIASAAIGQLQPDTEMSFNDFLHMIHMSNDEYILALRSTLKDDRVFLRREPNAVKINGYNRDILQTWQANMDIQFITDAYACAMYIISYISKGQRGMSELLRRSCDDARQGNSDIRQQVQSIANKFLRHVEISAQEAVFLVLQLPLRKSTIGFQFINTSPQEDRPFILKASDLLEKLPEDSEDVKCSNVIQRYTERPHSCYDICLADFAAWYDIVTRPKPKRSKTDKDILESDIEDNQEDNISQDEEHYEDMCKRMILTSKVVMRKRKRKKIIRSVRYSKRKDPENFFRELLMLYYPWRSEELIKAGCETYEEQYMKVKQIIHKKLGEYEQNAQELETAEQQLQDEFNDEMANDTAQCTNYENLRDRDANTNLINEEENLFTLYDIGRDLGVPGTDVQEELIRNRLSDDEFRSIVQSLNKKQREIFYHILNVTKVNGKQELLFLSGGAGVGKTRVVKALHQALMRHYNTVAGEEPEFVSVLLVAPTGKAAYLINGRTIHSAFFIPANQGFHYKKLTNEKCNTLRSQYQRLKVVIIDEISMCGSNMFHFINLRLQEVTQTLLPFGGLHVITVGDLFQLHPVQDQWIFKQPSSKYLPLAPNIWIDNFKLFELTEIMRQREDSAFAETLNRMREGRQNANDLALLMTRMISATDECYPKMATHIMYYNKSVQLHNNTIYDLSIEEKVEIPAIDIVMGDITADVKERILDQAPAKAQDAMGLAMHVKTAVGLRNELTLNVDTADGLVNGAGCITKMFTFAPNSSRPFVIWVEFEAPIIGQSLRSHSKQLYSRNISTSWTPLHTVSREFPVGRYKNAKLLRKQFPFQLSCAKTVHRSQGDTLESAVLSLPNEKRAHLHYVAFSRVTSLNKLFILGDFLTDKITVSIDVKNEMNRLRTSSQLAISPQLYNLNNDVFTITFLNCQSLRRHFTDIKADYNFAAANINMFVETKLCSSDEDVDVNLPLFNIFRNDFKHTRTPYGSAMYSQDNLTCSCQKLNFMEIEITFASFVFPFPINIVCIYCRPKENISKIVEAINYLKQFLDDDHRSIVMGDFNIHADANNSVYCRLLREMNALGLRQLINCPTTNGLTTIDHVYTDIDDHELQYGVLETYYSYHKTIWIAVRK